LFGDIVRFAEAHKHLRSNTAASVMRMRENVSFAVTNSDGSFCKWSTGVELD